MGHTVSFNSVIFLVFLASVYAVWRSAPRAWGRGVLCWASFVFYAYWFPPYILLLWTSGLIDFLSAWRMAGSRTPRRWLGLSIGTNLSILFTFKYFGLFQQTMVWGADYFGVPLSPWKLDLLLPVGISFYTFQSMSYTIDVYRGRLEPCRRITPFFTYLSFFPQFVAGPIVRAVDFLPQMKERRTPDAEDWQFILHRLCRGYFLKVVVADNIAISVNRIFATGAESLSLPVAWMGAGFPPGIPAGSQPHPARTENH